MGSLIREGDRVFQLGEADTLRQIVVGTMTQLI